ncbi:MAG: L-threonylcarbamoyladenylate synthase [Gammaproteobacteria bacterium]
MKPVAADDRTIAEAVYLLKRGGLVAFPTETVYGLGADAGNPAAVRRIFEAKGRPADHPLIVHVHGTECLHAWARNIPDAAFKLASRFWPGPLTLILLKQPGVSDVVTGGQDTVGLRVPDNPVALRLLKAFGGGLAAPSANRFKRVSPTCAEHVAEELGDRVDMILDGGPCRVGVESAIVDLSGERPVLLRPGQIGKPQLEAVLETEIAVLRDVETEIRAPGMMDVHYAPVTASLLCPGGRLADAASELMSKGKKIGVLSLRRENSLSPSAQVIVMPETADGYARALYQSLRSLDRRGLDLILVESPPETEEWRAVNDRLKKATAPIRGISE